MEARITTSSCKFWLFALVAIVSLIASPSSFAQRGPRHIAIDFMYPTTNDSVGEAWSISPDGVCSPIDQSGAPGVGCVLDFSSTSTSTITAGTPISIGFDVNLNGTTYKQLHVNQNGVLTFGAALGAYTPATSFAALQSIADGGAAYSNPFIAVFYPGTTPLVIPVADSISSLTNGGAEYGRGLAYPGADLVINPPIAGDVLAFKASWFECSDASNNSACILLSTFPTNPLQARIILYNRYDGTSATSDGDFDVRFEYGASVDSAFPTYDTTPANGQYGVVGFSLGSAANTMDVAGAVTAPHAVGTADIFYQFRKGVLVGTVTAATVPNVVNDTLADATTAIKAAGLIVGTTTTQSSITAAGLVISQSPAAGASAPTGSAVNLVLSSGPALVKVPSVVNQTVAVATTTLQSAGLKVGSVTKQASTTVPAGNVISQSPAAGTSVAAASAVNLVVSSGGLRGDVNNDGQVDVLDLIVVLEAYGKKVGPGDPRDLNGDGVVNLKDAVILVGLCTNAGCAIQPWH